MKHLIGIIFLGVISLMMAACGSGSSSQQATDLPVTINTSPQDQTVIAGQIAIFQVSASSPGQLNYKWQRNGSDISGANASSYETPPLSLADDAAIFTVRVWTSSASAVSLPATIHVYSETTIPAPVQYVINPQATDAPIDSIYGEHYAFINPVVSPKGKLFVFFSGTNSKPKLVLSIIQAAANSGYHALGLAYPNKDTVKSNCLGTNIDCPGNIHEEVLTGQDVSAQVDIAKADCIENRLLKLLNYLNQQYPSDGWGQFLYSDDTIQWSLIRVAGHSQGGSTAGYIGKRFAVDRVIFFSSPNDTVNQEVAAWVSAPGLTDPSRYYGFFHLHDELVPWWVIQQNWSALQMNEFGDYVSVDNHSLPYSASHMLTTNLDKPTNAALDPVAYHDMTALDYSMPLDSNGLPTYRHVWQYLCFL